MWKKSKKVSRDVKIATDIFFSPSPDHLKYFCRYSKPNSSKIITMLTCYNKIYSSQTIEHLETLKFWWFSENPKPWPGLLTTLLVHPHFLSKKSYIFDKLEHLIQSTKIYFDIIAVSESGLLHYKLAAKVPKLFKVYQFIVKSSVQQKQMLAVPV